MRLASLLFQLFSKIWTSFVHMLSFDWPNALAIINAHKSIPFSFLHAGINRKSKKWMDINDQFCYNSSDTFNGNEFHGKGRAKKK
jgi:hypothetical protein